MTNPVTPLQLRTRLFLLPFYEDRRCNVALIDKQECYGQSPDCSHLSDDSAYDLTTDVRTLERSYPGSG